MCEAITAMSASTLFQGAGLVFSAFGAFQNAQAQQDAAAYNAAVARNNQIIADGQADDAIRRGELDEMRHRIRVAQTQGQQRSALAAQNLDLTDGSALDTVLDTAEFGELDALIIRNNAEREAYGYRVQGMNAGAQAALYQSQANNTSPFLAAAGTALTGAGQVANNWNNLSGGSNALMPATAGGVPVSQWNGN